VKWSQRLRQTSRAAAKPQGRQQPRSLAPHRDWILGRLEQEEDLTMRALTIELCARGVVTSEVSVWRLVRDARLSFKKTLFAAEQDRPDVARKRRFWKKYLGRLAPERLVFLDETWAKTNMTRTRALLYFWEI
jgi:transposase